MKAAIVGLPKSGKSALFSAVTGMAVDPYAAPEPRQAVVRVPDSRLTYLTDLYNPKKVIEATFELIDVPGCALDDAHGQQEWRRLLPTVRQADLLVVVVRDFEDPAIPPYKGRIDADADFNAVWDELIFADLDAVTSRLERLEAALKKPTKTHEAEMHEQQLLVRCSEALELCQPLAPVIISEEDRRMLSSFAFLTEKPLVAVRNVSDDRAATAEVWEVPHVKHTLNVCASIEAEIAALDPQDRAVFLADLGLETPALDRVVRTCYEAAGLISFLTVGSDEVRAWTIPVGSTAVQAAGKIHTDFAKGFIRAETVAFEDLLAHKDMKGAKAAGLVRKEGKAYVVQDGDIMNILASA